MYCILSRQKLCAPPENVMNLKRRVLQRLFLPLPDQSEVAYRLNLDIEEKGIVPPDSLGGQSRERGGNLSPYDISGKIQIGAFAVSFFQRRSKIPTARFTF